METFTDEQLKHYVAYERVRAGGRFNMWAPQAIDSTGLSRKEYLFVMSNFTALRDAHTKQNASA